MVSRRASVKFLSFSSSPTLLFDEGRQQFHFMVSLHQQLLPLVASRFPLPPHRLNQCLVRMSYLLLSFPILVLQGALFLPPASWHLTDKDKLVWLFSVVLYVAWKRGLPRKFARFVLFRLIKKSSFNLLCVLDLFSERWQSTLFQTLFF